MRNLNPIDMMPKRFFPCLSSNLTNKYVNIYKVPITPPENRNPKGISIYSVERRKLDTPNPKIETKYTASEVIKL